MSFIRTHIENRSIFMLLLITLLCISYLCIATTIIYALGPIVPAAVVVLYVVGKAAKIVSVGMTVIGAIQIIKSQIKDLDEKIAGLEKEVPKLYARKNELWSRYEFRTDRVEMWKGRLKTAEKALTAAETATKKAETAKKGAKSKLDQSSEYEKKSKAEYMQHSCSICSQYGRMYCNTSLQAHKKWQGWKSQVEEDSTAYTAAKKAFKAKEKEEKDARAAVKRARSWKSRWESRARATLRYFNEAKAKHAEKVAELEQKRIERGVDQAALDVAMGKIDKAKTDLTDLKNSYPEAWTKVLDEDPELASKIQEILDYEEE